MFVPHPFRDTTDPDITHVIPAHNEQAYLPNTLDSVHRAAAAFEGQVEVIVVDNNSDDATADVARERGAQVVFERERIIAAARNAGAAKARGKILTFADADSMVSENFFTEAYAQLATGRCIGGNFAVRPDRTSLGIRLCTWSLLALLRLMFGVTGGSYFCHRKSFEAVGGFDTGYTYSEDIAFARALKKFGKTQGLKYVENMNAHIVTSTRKFDHFGDWFFLRHVLTAPWLLLGKGRNRKAIEAVFYDFDKSNPSEGFKESAAPSPTAGIDSRERGESGEST